MRPYHAPGRWLHPMLKCPDTILTVTPGSYSFTDDHSHLSSFLHMRLKEVNSKDRSGYRLSHHSHKLRQTRCLKTIPTWDLTALEGSVKSWKGRAGCVLLEAGRGESVSLPLAAPPCRLHSWARGHFLYFRGTPFQSLLPPSACFPPPSHCTGMVD